MCNLQEQDSTIMGYSFSKHLNLHDCLENKFFFFFFAITRQSKNLPHPKVSFYKIGQVIPLKRKKKNF
jgi:hypothetical protein